MTVDVVKPDQAGGLSPTLEVAVREQVDAYLAELKAKEKKRTKRMALIATKGTLDWAYPPLILASTAASLGWEVGVFFTFYGLNILHKKKGKKLRVAPLANPAMPPPFGLPMPPMANLLGAIPGMTAVGTGVMKKMFKDKGVATIDDLLQACIDTDVRLMPCQMTCDVFGYKDSDFIEAAERPFCGAATFIRFASEADVSLFV